MAGIDVAGHGLELARFVVAGVGPLSATGDAVRLADRRGRPGRWPVAAVVVSLVVHGVAVMLLLPTVSRPMAVPVETGFQLVFGPPAETAPNAVESPDQETSPNVVESPVQQTPAPPAVVQEVPRPADPKAATAEPPTVPASEPRDALPPAPALAQEAPPPKPSVPPKTSARTSHAVRPVRPQRSVEAPQASVPTSVAPPQVAAGPFVPPSPLAGMATNRAPAYPQFALRRGEQGTVMLRVSVSADGVPLAVDLAATSGYASLDSAAEAAVRQWRFNPATRAGIAVAAIADVPIRFRLSN